MHTSQHSQSQAYPQPPCPPGNPEAKIPYLHGGPAGFGEAIRQANRNRFTYRGRASRSAYWWHCLFGVIIIVACDVIFSVILTASDAGRSSGQAPARVTGAGPFIVLAVIILVILAGLWFIALPGLALSVRRLHDIGKSGWWLLIGLVPFGSIALLNFHCTEGTGPNRYDLGEG